MTSHAIAEPKGAAVEQRMTETLFGNPTMTIVGSVTGTAVAAFVAYHTMNPWLFVVCGLLVVAAIWRTSILLAFLRRRDRIEDVRPWERHFGVAVLSFSSLLGLVAFFGVFGTEEQAVHMFVMATLSSFVATAPFLHVTRPWIAAPQVAVMMIPAATGLVLSGGPIYWTLACLCLLQGVSLVRLALNTRNRFQDAFRGIDAERELSGRLNERNVLFQTALANMNSGFAIMDGEGRVVEANDRVYAMLGIERGDVGVSATIGDVACESHRHGFIDAVALKSITATFGTDFSGRGNALVRTREGRFVDIHLERTSVEQSVLRVVDVTDEWKDKEKIRHQAEFDDLTGLLNRRQGLLELAKVVDAADGVGALLFLDLDGFKSVNDLHGHAIGDEILRKVASRLTAATSGMDGMVARLGGDEFIIFSSGMDDVEACERFGNELILDLSREVAVQGRVLRVGATIGIAFATPETSVDELVANADMALNAAKNDGARGIRFYEPRMKSDATLRVALEQGLRATLARGGDELAVVYQPIVDNATRRQVGCEALVRWNHPVLRATPDMFIPVAEESTLICELGEWVLRRACEDAVSWQGDCRVAVNLSPQQFHLGDIVGLVSTVLRETGLPANRLELEIVESCLIHDMRKVVAIVRQLRDLGVHIALDDFGTGYSSLLVIHRLALTKIKIDRGFIANLLDVDPATRKSARQVIESVVGMARSGGVSVVAEGIETEPQLTVLLELGVAEGQGWLFSRPLPGEQFRQLQAAQPQLRIVA